MSQTTQRIVIGAMVALAIGALALGAAYQDDTKLDDGPRVVGGGTTALGPGQAAGDDTDRTTTPPTQVAGAIEGFMPRSGEASACREEIGVDLAPGFGAKLTINGIELAPEELNVNLDENGEITDEITASRSLGQYTFRPDDACPNGRWLRPIDNVLEVCVYRLSDAEQACAIRTERVFDAL